VLDGRYLVRCGRTGERPVPVDGLASRTGTPPSRRVAGRPARPPSSSECAEWHPVAGRSPSRPTTPRVASVPVPREG